jgi:hypothetical protein
MKNTEGANAGSLTRLVRCECGNNTFEKQTRVSGIWISSLTISPDGQIKREGSGDCVRTLKEPKYVRCEMCGKRHRNPESA